MTESTTINWPKELLEETQKVAKATGLSFESYVLQVLSERVDTTTTQPIKEISPTTQSKFNAKAAKVRKIGANWPRERMRQDWDWIYSHYSTLAKTYPNQWIVVHSQKVCGAARDLGKAEEQAEQVIGDVHQAHAVRHFVVTRNFRI